LDNSLGDVVQEGDVLGRISDPFGGSLSQIKSPCSGIIAGMNLGALVNRGDALVHVATIAHEETP